MDRDPPTDTRGIVDPASMFDLVDFARHRPGAELAGLVEWFWSVAWDLPAGTVHDQQVLNHPAGNISIGTIDDAGVPLDPAQGRVYGLQRKVSNRRLSGVGWTVAARTTVGGLGVFLDGPARAAADRQLPLDALPGLDGPGLVGEVIGAVAETTDEGTGTAPPRDTAQPGVIAGVDRLRTGLAGLLERRDPGLVAEAREMVTLVGRIEHDRTLCRVEQLAREVGVSVRSLQRQFDLHVGASPSFVIRRWRIIEAAESARAASGRGATWRGWAAVAAELGYADQAHLTRDFTSHLGVSPSAYVARNRTGAERA